MHASRKNSSVAELYHNITATESIYLRQHINTEKTSLEPDFPDGVSSLAQHSM